MRFVQAPTWQMTVVADSITAAQRIKLDRKPADDNMDEAAMLTDLKDRGYSWKGYGEKGAWHGSKETVEIWNDSTFRARVKKNVTGLSFYATDRECLGANWQAYVDHVNAFDPNGLDDDLSSMGPSNVAPSAPATPAKSTPSGSGSKRPRT